MSELKLQQCRLDGRYDIIECLGRGSYSEVYVARDTAAGGGNSPAPVVIKALNTYLQGMPDPELEHTLLANFRNEAVALDRVRHPNIISRLGHGTAIDLHDRTFHYLVIEYMPGGDLQVLCRRRPLTLEQSLLYFEQVCAGLAHAHRRGVIHRDIKPQNLLLSADHQTVKIADFGVAKIESAEGAITRVGTEVYAAPEHHPLGQTGPLDAANLSLCVRQLTPAADVYSLAKTAYMMLTGEAPRQFSQKPISELPPAVASARWAKFVLRVLNRATRTNPEERFQSVHEFWEELKDATMAQTQLLSEPRVKNLPPAAQYNLELKPAGGWAAAAPPPSFEVRDTTVAPIRAEQPHRPRIVVPIAAAPAAAPQKSAPLTPAPPPPPPHSAKRPRPEEAQVEAGALPSAQTRLSARARNWLVALLLITFFTGMLYALHHYVSGLRSGPTPVSLASPVGREFLTTTDVNLRRGPHPSTPRVGLAEAGSSVRILRVNGTWYEVQVLTHARPKEEPTSSDQGWLHSGYLRVK